MWQYNNSNKVITDSTCSRAWEFCKYIDTDLKHDLHTLPFTHKIDYVSVANALREIKYMGDFTYEADVFLVKFPQELHQEVLAFMCTVAKYFAIKIMA